MPADKFNCTSCGAPLRVDSTDETVVCDFCLTPNRIVRHANSDVELPRTVLGLLGNRLGSEQDPHPLAEPDRLRLQLLVSFGILLLLALGFGLLIVR